MTVRHVNRYHRLAKDYDIDVLGIESLAYFYDQAFRGQDAKILYRRCLEHLDKPPQLNDFDTPRVLTSFGLLYLMKVHSCLPKNWLIVRSQRGSTLR